jgi:hypothetical protein
MKEADDRKFANLVLLAKRHRVDVTRSGDTLTFSGGAVRLIADRARADGHIVTVHATPKRPRGKMLGDTWHAS